MAVWSAGDGSMQLRHRAAVAASSSSSTASSSSSSSTVGKANSGSIKGGQGLSAARRGSPAVKVSTACDKLEGETTTAAMGASPRGVKRRRNCNNNNNNNDNNNNNEVS